MDIYPTKIKVIAKSGPREWQRVEKERFKRSQDIDLKAKDNNPFRIVLIQEILALISKIDQDKGFLSSLKLPESYVSARSYYALKKEAYYSSRIEGAVTTLEVALRNLDKKKKSYDDESMQMIYNNKLALEFMHQHKINHFSRSMILELHKILLYNTHKDRPITVGQYRKGPIYVIDEQGRVVYEGPAPEKAISMMKQFIVWMNQEPHIHPLVDAALVHLYFVHIHPFDDGNGRSARALSNLYLEKNGYHFINLLSPSDYFEHHRAEYYKSIQATRNHGYDATYFILYYLEALKDQLAHVRTELKRDESIGNIKNILDQDVKAKLNIRQIKTIQWMLENFEPISTRKHCKLNKCSDETARKDFNLLKSLKLIKTQGAGRSTKYILSISLK